MEFGGLIKSINDLEKYIPTEMGESGMTPKTIQLNPEDNVVLALSDIAPGQLIGHGNLRSFEKIPSGHKVAIKKIGKKEAEPSTKWPFRQQVSEQEWYS